MDNKAAPHRAAPTSMQNVEKTHVVKPRVSVKYVFRSFRYGSSKLGVEKKVDFGKFPPASGCSAGGSVCVAIPDTRMPCQRLANTDRAKPCSRRGSRGLARQPELCISPKPEPCQIGKPRKTKHIRARSTARFGKAKRGAFHRGKRTSA